MLDQRKSARRQHWKRLNVGPAATNVHEHALSETRGLSNIFALQENDPSSSGMAEIVDFRHQFIVVRASPSTYVNCPTSAR